METYAKMLPDHDQDTYTLNENSALHKGHND
jgi:hypothetical protein